MRGAVAFFIRNFVQNRVFHVKIANVKSREFVCVFSVTLFSIAINDILQSISNEISKSLYVDDLVIYYVAANINHIERKL